MLSEGAINSALTHQKFNLEILEAEAIGDRIGGSVGERILESTDAKYYANFYASYGRVPAPANYATQVASQSRAANDNVGQSNANPNGSYGAATQAKTNQQTKQLNQFGIFGGGKQTSNQTQYSDQQFENMLQDAEFSEVSGGFGASKINEENSILSLPNVFETVNSSARDAVSTFAGKYAPSYFNLSNNYYAKIVSVEVKT